MPRFNIGDEIIAKVTPTLIRVQLDEPETVVRIRDSYIISSSGREYYYADAYLVSEVNRAAADAMWEAIVEHGLSRRYVVRWTRLGRAQTTSFNSQSEYFVDDLPFLLYPEEVEVVSVEPHQTCPACGATFGDADRRCGTVQPLSCNGRVMGCTRCMVVDHFTGVPISRYDGYAFFNAVGGPVLTCSWESFRTHNLVGCDVCGEAFNPATVAMVGRTCPTCDGLMTTCEDCGERYRSDRGHRCAFARVNSYSFKPEPVFHGDGPLFLGFELEVESRGSWSIDDGVKWCAQHSDRGNLYYLKDDGSLNNGFEIVTHPLSMEWAMREFPWHMLDGLRTNGFRSWNTSTCGLHVHLSRSAFDGNEHMLRFLLLAYKSSKELVKLAGRNSTQWASWTTESDDSTLRRKSEGAGGARYVAINTNNSATIEMRFFRGSLNVQQVKSALQWCHAMWEYTKSATMDELTWPEFSAFVSANAKRFPELEDRIVERVRGGVVAALVATANDDDYDSSSDSPDEDEDEYQCQCWDCRYDRGEVDSFEDEDPDDWEDEDEDD